MNIQAALSDIESNIAVARQVYNDTVLTFNNGIQTFPAVVLAGAPFFHSIGLSLMLHAFALAPPQPGEAASQPVLPISDSIWEMRPSCCE